MPKYGTKEYYEEELHKTEQRLKIMEEAVTALLTAGKVTISNIVFLANMLEELREAVKTKKQNLEEQNGA